MKNKKVLMSDEHLLYSGRIDFCDRDFPKMIFPYSSVEFNFKGTYLKIKLINKCNYWDNFLGFIIDGKQDSVELKKDESEQTITLAENLEDAEHHVFIFKRQDGCHLIQLNGLFIDEDGLLLDKLPMKKRCMEFYGDSVTAGEVSEAVGYEGQLDPEDHMGRYSNSYYSYATIAARALDAQVNLVAQGGVALLDGTGYFGDEDYLGMESIYDKCQYNPDLDSVTEWNFSDYIPHVVVVSIGQNDNHPIDFMKDDFNGEEAQRWRQEYKRLILDIRSRYKDATIILQTTLLTHDESWDIAIESVQKELGDDKIHHLMYRRNGSGTLGHLRISEAQEMADELVEYINGLEGVWE
jgi:hypothetical protein